MKKTFNAAFLVIGICIFLLAILWGYASLNAKKIFEREVAGFTGRPVSTKAVYPSLPLGIVVKGLKVEGLLTAGKIYAGVDLWALLHREIRVPFFSVSDAILFLEAKDGGGVNVPSGLSLGRVPSGASADVTVPVKAVLEHLQVHNGMVHLKTGQGRTYVVEKIDADFKNIPLSSKPVRTEFFLTASLRKMDIPFVGHLVKAKGWLNWAERNMDAAAQAVDDDGRVGLDVKCVSVRNDVLVTGKVRLSGGQQVQASGKRSGLVENVVLSALEAFAGNIEAEFSFRTQMDHFKVEQLKLQGNITTGLNSEGSSSNIVESLKALGSELIKDDSATGVK